MAEEHAIDITQIVGTGPGGRIARQDIEKAVAAKGAAPEKAPAPAEVAEGKKVKTTIPLKGMRATIAEHMHRSLSVAAQLTAMGEIDMTQMVKLRKDLVDQVQQFCVEIASDDTAKKKVRKVLDIVEQLDSKQEPIKKRLRVVLERGTFKGTCSICSDLVGKSG